MGYLAHGGRIVLFLPIGHALNPVASGVDFTGGDFHLAGLETVFVQGHLAVAAADGHLVEGYVLLGGDLDGTVVVGQLDVVAAFEVLEVLLIFWCDCLYVYPINFTRPAGLHISRIFLNLFIQVVQGIDDIVVLLVPDVLIDVGYVTEVCGFGHVVDDHAALLGPGTVHHVQAHLVVVADLIGICLHVGIVLLGGLFSVADSLFQLIFRSSPAGDDVVGIPGLVRQPGHGTVIAADGHHLVAAGTVADGHGPAVPIDDHGIVPGGTTAHRHFSILSFDEDVGIALGILAQLQGIAEFHLILVGIVCSRRHRNVIVHAADRHPFGLHF